eukprot:6208995-Pleurochrysis_carterae.AAC.1
MSWPKDLDTADTPLPLALGGVRRCSTWCPLPSRFVTGRVRTRSIGLSRPTNHGSNQSGMSQVVETSAMSGQESLDTADTPLPPILGGVWWCSTPV